MLYIVCLENKNVFFFAFFIHFDLIVNNICSFCFKQHCHFQINPWRIPKKQNLGPSVNEFFRRYGVMVDMDSPSPPSFDWKNTKSVLLVTRQTLYIYNGHNYVSIMDRFCNITFYMKPSMFTFQLLLFKCDYLIIISACNLLYRY